MATYETRDGEHFLFFLFLRSFSISLSPHRCTEWSVKDKLEGKKMFSFKFEEAMRQPPPLRPPLDRLNALLNCCNYYRISFDGSLGACALHGIQIMPRRINCFYSILDGFELRFCATEMQPQSQCKKSRIEDFILHSTQIGLSHANAIHVATPFLFVQFIFLIGASPLLPLSICLNHSSGLAHVLPLFLFIDRWNYNKLGRSN